ncbi:MAG: endonuclease/exonuclease/phosphatase family protein [Clostridiales bacterium]|nr:endonuclease/exonuclease/phosphatase family protein [Clostridiales bacterium]
MRGFFRVLLTLLIIIVVAAAALVAWLWIAEYRPADVEVVTATAGVRHDFVQTGKTYHIVTLNTGYGGLDRDRDFFMDGGSEVMPESRDEVEENLAGMLSALYGQQADLVLLQEVDVNSKRSYHIDQADYYTRGLSMGRAFAYNFKVPFVPFPIPPIGKVESGLLTLSNLKVEEAQRVSLPNAHPWPISLANLKRVLLVEYLPVDESDRKLVLINLHLEAYTSGEARQKQLDVLLDIMESERKKGNYVIAGGDFNANFPGAEDWFPITDENVWTPGDLSPDDLPDGFRFVYDPGVPTCRSLDKAYLGNRREHVMYVIDGYIVSDNIKVNGAETIDLNFLYTDHQPVAMDFTLI